MKKLIFSFITLFSSSLFSGFNFSLDRDPDQSWFSILVENEDSETVYDVAQIDVRELKSGVKLEDVLPEFAVFFEKNESKFLEMMPKQNLLKMNRFVRSGLKKILKKRLKFEDEVEQQDLINQDSQEIINALEYFKQKVSLGEKLKVLYRCKTASDLGYDILFIKPQQTNIFFVGLYWVETKTLGYLFTLENLDESQNRKNREKIIRYFFEMHLSGKNPIAAASGEAIKEAIFGQSDNF